MTVQELADKITELVVEAREPLPERSHPLTADDFVALWRGDEHSQGYANILLAHEVMKRRKYASVDLLRTALYPTLGSDEIPAEGLRILTAAFEFYDKRRQAES
jgi:hypothetical protein